MPKKKHVTFGGMGQHEFYMPTTGAGHQNRRDRKRCEYYFEKSGYCTKIRNQCVGPAVCMKYQEKRLLHSIEKPRKIAVGTAVYSQHRGQGKIVTISEDICTVEFFDGKKSTFKYPEAFKNGLLSRKPFK